MNNYSHFVDAESIKEASEISKINELCILVFWQRFCLYYIFVFFFAVFAVKFYKYFILDRFGSKIVIKAPYLDNIYD